MNFSKIDHLSYSQMSFIRSGIEGSSDFKKWCHTLSTKDKLRCIQVMAECDGKQDEIAQHIRNRQAEINRTQHAQDKSKELQR